MITNLDLIKQSSLINRLVLDRHTTEELGRIDQVWLNPQLNQIVGFTYKSGLLGSKKRSFSWKQIETIGNDSILVNINSEDFASGKPDSAVYAIGYEVWTDAGNKVGKLVDYLFLRDTGTVVNYLFTSNGWRGILDGVYQFAPTAITSAGSKRMIIADAVVQEPQFYTEGLNQKVASAADFLKEDYEKTKRDLEGIKRVTKDISEQVKDKTAEITDKAKEKLSDDKVQPQKSELPIADTTIDIKAESLPLDTNKE